METKNRWIEASIKENIERKLIAMGAKYKVFITFYHFQIAIVQGPKQGAFFTEKTTVRFAFNHRTGKNLSVLDFLDLDDEEFEKLAEEAIIGFILEGGT